MIKVGIYAASGHMGSEALWILLKHPNIWVLNGRVLNNEHHLVPLLPKQNH